MDRLYFDYGSKTLDLIYKPYPMQMDTPLKAGGYNAKNGLSLEFPGENHSEKSWKKRWDIPLTFLLKK